MTNQFSSSVGSIPGQGSKIFHVGKSLIWLMEAVWFNPVVHVCICNVWKVIWVSSFKCNAKNVVLGLILCRSHYKLKKRKEETKVLRLYLIRFIFLLPYRITDSILSLLLVLYSTVSLFNGLNINVNYVCPSQWLKHIYKMKKIFFIYINLNLNV